VASKRQIEAIFREAASLLSAGDAVTAELRCQTLLSLAPDDAPALGLMGALCVRLGHLRSARHYFRRAAARDAVYGDALAQVEAALTMAPRAPRTRFLIAKAWGYGFWADVNHLCGCLLLSEITRRIPITLWGTNTLFGDGRHKDAFALYFKPVSEKGLDDLPLLTPRSLYPPKWVVAGLDTDDHMKLEGPGSRLAGLYFLERPEAVVVADYFVSVASLMAWLPETHPLRGRSPEDAYRYLAAKYLKPKRRVLAAADAFYRAHLAGAPSIAVHMRGSDKLLEADTTDLLPLYFEQLDREDAATRIFLLTDDERCIAPFRDRYGGRVILSDVARTGSDIGIHHSGTVAGTRLGYEVMTDTYTALRCDRFLGNGMSNLSAFVAVLKPWAANACVLLGGSILNVRRL
jgi:hypothetical protein